jgi:ferredoxin
MKIVIDYDLCEANAVCMDTCPECFRVEEDDEAVRLCPRQAISLANE